MIIMNVLSMMHWIVGGIVVEMWWIMWLFLQMKLMKLWVVQNDASEEPLVTKPITLNEVTKQNKRRKIKVLEHFSTMAKKYTTMLQ